MKKLLKIITFVISIITLIIVWLLNSHIFNGIDEASNHCRNTHFYVEGQGDNIVFGAEDMEIDHENGLAFISAYDRSLVATEVLARGEVSEGGMYVWDLNKYPPDSERIEVRDISANVRADIEFRPHGTSMLLGDGWWRFFVVNHAFPNIDGVPTHEGQVLILDYIKGQLEIDEVITASLMCSPNDVQNIGPNQFFVTNDHGACDAKGKFREEMLKQKAAYLLYWDGNSMTKVATNIGYANGVSIDPNNPDHTYVAGTTEARLHIFNTQDLLSSNIAEPTDSFSLPYNPDNLTWTTDGRLISGGFPNLYRFAAYRAGAFGVKVTPAIAMAISEPKTNPKYEVLFNNETGLMRGATVASIYDGYTIATSVFDDRVLICTN